VAVQREKQPLLDTLKELVSIESGSSDFDGVTRIGDPFAERLRALGGEVFRRVCVPLLPKKENPTTGRFSRFPASRPDGAILTGEWESLGQEYT
jgi:hypothetical protein